MQGKDREDGLIQPEDIPCGILVCGYDADLNIAEVNDGFYELFGFSPEKAIRSFSALLHPSDRRRILDLADGLAAKAGTAGASYRVLCGAGDYKPVYATIRFFKRKGESFLYFVMLDATDLSESGESPVFQNESPLTIEKYQTLMGPTADIVFEWNSTSDTVSCSSSWENKFGYALDGELAGYKKSIFPHVHPEDVPGLEKCITGVKGGNQCPAYEIRIRHEDGRYIWCKVRMTARYSKTKGFLKLGGVISDIDVDKKVLDDLRQRAERDALTGLYNRTETEVQIRRYLKRNPDGRGALLIIDADNFKQINDTQGHLFGDAVLSELAASMKALVRQTDIVGRIGGDEFAIFLKDVPSANIAENTAEKLLEVFRHLFQGEKRLVTVTCSAGVAMYPDDGGDFVSLYHSADIALYQAKSLGRDRYVLFDSRAVIPLEQANYSSLGASIDSDQKMQDGVSNLVSYVFQILYDSHDMDHSIQLILAIVGKRFDVSRAYVFENSEDNRFANNTYEWCNEGILPQKESLQRVSYAELDGYEELFQHDAVFYCRDIHSLAPSQVELFERQGVRSTLQCAIRDRDVFCGFIGFDECTGMRLWTKEEVSLLTLISQLLSTFLQKKRVVDRDHQLAVRLNAILDVQDAYIYAVRQDNYELLYLNDKTKELDSTAQVGMPCYHAFFGKDKPCETCPLRGKDYEIYNPQYDVWTKVKVASLRWGEYDAYLLSCFDITDYKRIGNEESY